MDTRGIVFKYPDNVDTDVIIPARYLNAPAPEVITFFSDFINNPAPDGMEQLSDVVARAGEFLEDRCRDGGNILISTHAIAMKGLLEYLTPDSQGSYWSKYVGNCAVYAAEACDGSWGVPAELDMRA
jgi:broad specificity phosphatase PhoE